MQDDNEISISTLGGSVGSALVAADLAALITHKRRSGFVRSSVTASPSTDNDLRSVSADPNKYCPLYVLAMRGGSLLVA